MSKRARAIALLRQGKLNRAEVARAVGMSYQSVRNAETFMLSLSWKGIIPPDPPTSPITDCSVLEPCTKVLLWEERPMRYKE